MCEIKLPMKFKVDFSKGEDFRSVFDSLVDKGLVSSFSAKFNVSRVLDEQCKDGLYYFTITKNKFNLGINLLTRVTKYTYDGLDYNEFVYHQNQWISRTSETQMNSDESRYCNGVKLPKAVDRIVHGKNYYFPTPTSYSKSSIIWWDTTSYDSADRLVEILESGLLYDTIEDSNIHSDAMLLTHSPRTVDKNEPKEILIHEHGLTEMKIKLKSDEEFMAIQQYFFNRDVDWIVFGEGKQFIDNKNLMFPVKYIFIIEKDWKFYMKPGHTDAIFESNTSPVGIFDILKVIK